LYRGQRLYLGSSFNLDQQSRGKHSVAVNMKSAGGQQVIQDLSAKSDVILDPFRPGVMERLGCGPDVLLERNPELIFARLSGFGQTGPMSDLPGHDINYIAQSGVLSALVDANGKPIPPINLVADFAGGGLLLTNGILAALFERTKSGQGQVLDLSMAEGSAYASSFLWQMGHMFNESRGQNMLDGGAHFYGTYQTKDNRYMAVGAIEPQFYAVLIEKLGLSNQIDLGEQMDSSKWPEMKTLFENTFQQKTQFEWSKIFEGSEACTSPILTFEEAAVDPHNVAREAFFDAEGVTVPSPQPIFSRSKSERETVRPDVGENTKDILKSELQYSEEQIQNLFRDGAIA